MNQLTSNVGTWKLAKLGLAVLMSAVVTLMLLFLAGVFHRKVSLEPAGSLARPSAGLPTVAVQQQHRVRFETATGTVKPVHESAVASKLLAKVLQLNVTAGQSVVQDEILVKLDDAELLTRLRQAEATVAAATARREQTAIEFGRAESLKASSAISESEYDAALSLMKIATAELDRAEQSVAECGVLIEHATIRAPMSGTIVDKRVDVGDTVSPGQVLLTLFDPTHMQMVASVRESLARGLRVGQKLPTRLDALDFECEATISEVVPEADAASRSFTVKVTGPCPPRVYSGMFGRLMLPLDDEIVLVIPESTVKRVGQLTMVDVVRGDSVFRQNIRIGRTWDTEVEVLSGLAEGDLVVLGK